MDTAWRVTKGDTDKLEIKVRIWKARISGNFSFSKNNNKKMMMRTTTNNKKYYNGINNIRRLINNV